MLGRVYKSKCFTIALLSSNMHAQHALFVM